MSSKKSIRRALMIARVGKADGGDVSGVDDVVNAMREGFGDRPIGLSEETKNALGTEGPVGAINSGVVYPLAYAGDAALRAANAGVYGAGRVARRAFEQMEPVLRPHFGESVGSGSQLENDIREMPAAFMGELNVPKSAARTAVDIAKKPAGPAERGMININDNIPSAQNQNELRDNLVKSVVEHFGVTEDPREAGYILHDGRMLDLSGGEKGARERDHRELPNDMPGEDRTEKMHNFMKDAGAARVSFKHGSFQAHEPTDAQLKAAVDGAMVSDGDLTVVKMANDGQEQKSAKIRNVTVPKLRAFFKSSGEGHSEKFKHGGAVNHAPSEAQKDAGNYKKEHVNFQGLDISIENKKGSVRSGKDANGKPWSCKLPADYGYIKGTEGADGDHVDVYLGPDKSSHAVFIVNQHDLKGGFDEHKAMIGFKSERDAMDTYCKAFSDGKGVDRLGSLETVSMDAFKKWLKSEKTKKPAHSRNIVEHALKLVSTRQRT